MGGEGQAGGTLQGGVHRLSVDLPFSCESCGRRFQYLSLAPLPRLGAPHPCHRPQATATVTAPLTVTPVTVTASAGPSLPLAASTTGGGELVPCPVGGEGGR